MSPADILILALLGAALVVVILWMRRTKKEAADAPDAAIAKDAPLAKTKPQSRPYKKIKGAVKPFLKNHPGKAAVNRSFADFLCGYFSFFEFFTAPFKNIKRIREKIKLKGIGKGKQQAQRQKTDHTRCQEKGLIFPLLSAGFPFSPAAN